MIRIGPAGWKYKDWEGVVYPTPAPRGFDALAYIADYFTTVEINSSYYGPPRPETARKWLRSVDHNSQFRFTAKLFHSFTHERKPVSDDERNFKAGIGPLMEAGPLGAVLIQFSLVFQERTGESRIPLARAIAVQSLPAGRRSSPRELDYG